MILGLEARTMDLGAQAMDSGAQFMDLAFGRFRPIIQKFKTIEKN